MAISEAIRFRLNGREVEARGVDPNTTLLHWLRASGLTGSKEGCAEGECGACAVALVETGPDGRTRYEAINSCLFLVAQAQGREIVSVEGVAPSERALHPVQEAMARGGGSQCGYCTPGFVVSLFAEYYRGEEGPLDEESFAGNLCRCTGYRPIRDAAHELATIRRTRSEADDAHRERLAAPAPESKSFAYAASTRRFHRPTTLAEATALLAHEPELTIVAGGTDVVVDINQRHVRHAAIVSLDRVAELRGVRIGESAIEIGAGEPLARLEERLHGTIAMFDQLLPLFSSRLIRTRATLGGNLVTASPIGDSPPVLLALGAEVVIAGPNDDRAVAIDEFFAGYRKTALAKGELVRAVRIPRPLPGIQRFYKVSKRRMDDISTVAGAFAIDVDARGVVTSARLAFGGVAATPIRARRAEAALIGKPFGHAAIGSAVVAARGELAPIDDHRGSAKYRRAMIGALLEKLVADESETVATR
ncbi:xanthine dehydrogenase small subunit [Sandaracinus amylolyticus]|uniref:Xanthine dehydrogenase iron-sulfur subunit n=1 Tax=Sandaracinus amylolyticus TaxID=927083 RepID=A0A0F6YMP2_9BACT|nr:FAD binding domain-containing protein [Sandaracinus amylolyticus]AKF11257.1 Xanthine dehydrogenase iron-sulfur subunit [Sandaracinus amylolyticus]